MKAMVESALPLGSLARLTRTTDLAILQCVKVFRIDHPHDSDFGSLQAAAIDHRSHSSRGHV
jgi:hypothetical protein